MESQTGGNWFEIYLPQVVEWDDVGQVAGEEFKDGEDGVQHPVG